jgi:hypothetical protein
MKMRSLVVPLSAVVVLGGCVTVPVGPMVRVLPGSQKSFEQFRNDDAGCRQYAQAAIGGPEAGQNAANAAAGNAVAGSLIGAAAGAILGSVSGQAGAGAAIGAGTGLLFGSAAGSNVAGYSSYAMQRNYDTAYMQCMYAHGNQVPGAVAYRSSAPQYSPSYYPPPRNPAPGAASGNYPPPGYPAPGAPAENNPPPSYPPPNTPPPRG